jgi:hypothetical protein
MERILKNFKGIESTFERMFELLRKRADFFLSFFALYFAFQIGTNIVKENYSLVAIFVLFSIWLLVSLNLKRAFFFLIILVPFSFTIKTLTNLFLTKSIALVIGSYKDLLIFSIMSFLVLSFLKNKSHLLKISKLHVSILFFILLCLVLFFVNSNNFIAGLVGLRKTIIFTSMFFMARFLLKDEDDIKIFVNCVLGVGFIVALGTVIQYFFLPDTMSISAMSRGDVNMNQILIDGYYFHFLRPSSFFEGANVLGFYLAYLAAFMVGIILVEKETKYHLLKFSALLMVLIALILTLSRGAWIALVGGILVWGLIKFRYLLRKFTFLLLIGIIISISILSSPLISFRLQSIFDPYDDSKNSRLLHYTRYWGEYFNLNNTGHFLIGKGLGTTGAVPEMFESNEFKSGFMDLYYLELYQDIGIFGLGSFLLILFFYLRILFILEKKPSNLYFKPLLNGMILATFTFILSGFFTGVGASFAEATIFWSFIGLSEAIQRVNE